MGRAARARIASQVLKELRNLSYDECRDLMKKVSTKVVTGDDGQKFQVEIEAFWDDGKRKNIRVQVAVSDGGWSDFVPTVDAFIISPDGSFVGEGSLFSPKG